MATGEQEQQLEDHDPALLPVRMISEYAYCPRLFHLMHVEGRWEDNRYTIEGRDAHRRVDREEDESLPAPDKNTEDSDPAPTITRSVTLASEALGIVAKLDLVETRGDDATPVDTKRGRVPDTAERSWEPERVQLMAQGLLLRAHGFVSERGVLYYAASRTRVDVPFTPELEARTRHLVEQARQAARRPVLPAPLDGSPKCNGCSLSGICLPDETLALQQVPPDTSAPAVRRLYPARDDALPLYVQEQGSFVGKSGESLIVRKNGEDLARARLKDVAQLVLCGNITISAPTIHLLCEAGVAIVHLSRGHWFYGVTTGTSLRNAYDRAAQYRAASAPEWRVAIARELVRAKVQNQRTLLRRNASPRPGAALLEMDEALASIDGATEIPSLLGTEGRAARAYFGAFAGMLRPRDFDVSWSFDHRNRRPPRDPVNAMLSFGYALLVKECTVALLGEGLDPWWGLFHQPRHGRPSLALDLMEEFRPVVADSAVVTAINTGMVEVRDFELSSSGCAMRPSARKALIRAYEARLDQLIIHPRFDYRCSWRSVIRLQARLLARWLRGDLPTYTGMVTR